MKNLTDDDIDYVWSIAAAGASKIENDKTSTVTVYPKDPFVVGTGYTLTLNTYKKGTTTAISGTTPLSVFFDTETNLKPTITASALEAVVDGDAIKLTIKDANGKEVKDLTQYTVEATPGAGATIAASKDEVTFTAAGAYKLTVKGPGASGPTSEAITITARTTNGVKATDIKLDVDNVKLTTTTGTADVEATVLPDGTAAGTTAAEIGTVTAKSNDTSIATVAVKTPKNGSNMTVFTITGVAAGETTVDFVSDDGNYKKSVNVTVPGYKGIVLTSDTTEVEIGKTITISADVQVYGDSFSKDINWASSDTSVATVKDGVVTGVAEGTAKIYATAKNDVTKKSNELAITVKKASEEESGKPSDSSSTTPTTDPTKPADQSSQTPAAQTGLAANTEGTATSGETVKTNADASGVVLEKATNKKSVTVPETVTVNGKEYPVTEIKAKAFGKKTTKVTVKKGSLTKIAKNAFKGSKVKKITAKGIKKTSKLGKQLQKAAKVVGAKITWKK